MQYLSREQLDADSLCERLAALGLDQTSFSALRKAYEASSSTIEQARKALKDAFGKCGDFDDCVIFGSIARREATACSDLDYLLIGTSGPASSQESSASRVYNLLKDLAPEASKFSPPGKTGLFGKFIPTEDLVTGIGLQQDTNETLTRRILLLEESVPLLDPDGHARLVHRIIESYMALRSPHSTKPPRVLINDIIRYWRTIAVDYHAKSSENNARYSLRYLKLLFSRQLCYFSSIAPMPLVVGMQTDDAARFLVEQFSSPPIFRTITLFEGLFEDAEVRERLQPLFETIITSMNTFVSLSGNSEWRRTIESECRENRSLDEMPTFSEAREVGVELHQALATVLLDPVLVDFTKEYVLL